MRASISPVDKRIVAAPRQSSLITLSPAAWGQAASIWRRPALGPLGIPPAPTPALACNYKHPSLLLAG